MVMLWVKVWSFLVEKGDLRNRVMSQTKTAMSRGMLIYEESDKSNSNIVKITFSFL